jgi:hypothetical protein
MAYIGLGAGTVRIYGSLRATSLTLARVILTQMHVVIDGGIEVTGGPTTSQSYVGTTFMNGWASGLLFAYSRVQVGSQYQLLQLPITDFLPCHY